MNRREHFEILANELGDVLSRVQLALTSMALIESGFSDDRDEPTRILSSLCADLVERGAVDPLEEAAASKEAT